MIVSKKYFLLFFPFLFSFSFASPDGEISPPDGEVLPRDIQDLFISGYRGRSELLDRVRAAEEMMSLRAKAEGKVKALDRMIKNEESKLDGDVDKREIKKKIKKLKRERYEWDHMGRLPGVGDVIARGLGGESAKYVLKDIWLGDDLVEGIQFGMYVRSSDSIGKELGSSIDRFVKGGLGAATGSIMSFFRYINNMLFHNGHYPFEVSEIKGWRSLIIGDLQSLEKMIKDGGKNESRSRDMIQREFGDKEENEKENIHFIWNDFSDFFAEKCIFIVNEIAERKKYYGKKDLIIFYSSQLQKRLLSIAKLVLKRGSLKEFSSLGEVSSVLMPIRKSLEKLFEVLEKHVESSQSYLNKRGKSSFYVSNYSSDNNSGGYAHDYPAAFDY